jgi:predicted HicB family RNase H-like nuclease
MPGMKKKLTVMVEEEEIQVWKEAAFARRVSLSEWVRRVLTSIAEQTPGVNDGQGKEE